MSQTLDRSASADRTGVRSTMGFGLTWMLLTAIGFMAGLLIGFGFMWGMGDSLEAAVGQIMAAAVSGLGGGLIIGASLGLQAMAFGGRVRQPARWALMSAVGGAMAMAILLPLVVSQEPADGPGVLLGAGAFIGLVIGGGQWLAFRSQVKGLGWWIALSAVALGLAMAISFGLGEEGRELVSVGAGGLVAGTVEGAGMAWLWRNR
ncbi:MAG: hypothetical protein ACK2U9_24470 [Anaerolineae bacterium]